MSEDRHDGKFLFGFFLGGLIGALIIFFLGTKEGKKAEKIFRARGKDILDELEEKLDELQEKGKDLVRHGEELKEQVMDTLEDKKEEFSERAVEKIGTALERIEEIQQKGMDTTATLRKKFRNLPKKS
jgi:gas vesicle protein